MLRKIIIVAFLLVSVHLYAQDSEFKVHQYPVVSDFLEQYYYPQFSPDDSKLLFTKSNFSGLYYYDLKTNELVEMTNLQGAGYKPVFSDDGQSVYYRINNYKKRRIYYSIIGQNIYDLKTIIFEQDQRDLSTVKKLRSGEIVYSSKENLKEIKNNILKKDTAPKEPFATVYKSRSVLVNDGDNETVLQPLGEKFYLWPSVSPDGTKLLFTVAGLGTFVSDLNGNILAELGYANAPQWSPNGNWIVFMREYDDGHRYTGSEIYLIKPNGSGFTQLTKTPDIIEMYPQWSHSGKQIVCAGLNGSLYLITLEQN